jgi:hypothetical protein
MDTNEPDPVYVEDFASPEKIGEIKRIVANRPSREQQSARTGGVRLPMPLYDRLRREGYERHISQNTIIVDALTRYFADLDSEEETHG